MKHGFAFPGGNIREEPPGDILLTPGNFAVGGGFKGDKYKYFDGQVPEEYVLYENDLIVTMTDLSKQADTLGYPALVPRPQHFRFLHNQRLGKVVIRDGATHDKRFISYLLRTPEYRHEVLASATGTTVKHTSPSRILAFKTSIPPLPEQRAIAHILGTLDDKIELNRRMNETLEAMARALFKSWFVDFDPVRAKSEGRDPGLPQPLADLFPDSFEDSKLGEIPKGWEVQRVGDIGTIVCGKTPPTQVSEYYGPDVPFITIPDMHRRIFATSVHRRLSHAGAQSQEKKMLPAGTICVSCIATAGLVVITSELSQTNQQINSVLPNQKDATYFWYWTLRNLGDDIRAGGSGGSVLTNLSTGRFGELRLLASVAGLRSRYHSIAAPVFGRILENECESGTLAAMRDTLLPKLISGALRIPFQSDVAANSPKHERDQRT